MGARMLVVRGALCLAVAALPLGVRAQGTPAAPTVSEAEASAREAFQRGRIHYDNGEFQKAADAFEQAYKLSHRHALLYNLYLAYRDATEQEKAAEALRNYLDRVEVIENRPQLEARLKALEEGIAERQAAEAQKAEEERKRQELAAQQAAAAQQTSKTEQAEPVGKWWLTPVMVMSAGGVVMASSAITGSMSNRKYDELHSKCKSEPCDPGLKSVADSGHTLAVVTDALLFGGAAVAVTGAVLFFLKKPKRSEQPSADSGASASFVCTSRVCGGSFGMRF